MKKIMGGWLDKTTPVGSCPPDNFPPGDPLWTQIFRGATCDFPYRRVPNTTPTVAQQVGGIKNIRQAQLPVKITLRITGGEIQLLG